jgi:hypothetical protein
MSRAGRVGDSRALRTMVLLICVAVSGTSSCGYRVHSSLGNLPSGIQSLGIPTFENRTYEFKLEQVITGAVLKEFSLRTRIPVNSHSTGVDAVLFGEIRSINATPVTFGSDTFASVFLVTVQMGVKLVRAKDSKILWENNDFSFRERYQLNSNLKDFFSEESPALDRLSREFAASLVSAVINR